MSQSSTETTTIRLSKPVKERFDNSKPYDSLSADEFVDVLLDEWDRR